MLKLVGIGYVFKEPEDLKTVAGTQVTSFGMRFPGRKNEETTFISNINAWGKLAEIAMEHFKKGKQIYVELGVTTQKWTDREGNERKSERYRLNEFAFAGDARPANGAEPAEHAGAPEEEELPF